MFLKTARHDFNGKQQNRENRFKFLSPRERESCTALQLLLANKSEGGGTDEKHTGNKFLIFHIVRSSKYVVKYNLFFKSFYSQPFQTFLDVI